MSKSNNSRKQRRRPAWFAKKRKGRAGKKTNAYVSSEHDWPEEVAKINPSRVFGIILLLHVLAVCGIIAYEYLQDAQPVSSSTRLVSEADASPAGQVAAPTGRVVDTGIETKEYRVLSGDSLPKIAAKAGSTVEEITSINGLRAGAAIYPGLVLHVPVESRGALRSAQAEGVLGAPPQTAPPAPGPVLVAEVSPPQVALPEKQVPKAQPYRPPSASPPDSGQEPKKTPTPAPAGNVSFIEYTVRKGDTLYGLGRAHGVKPDAIIRASGLTDTNIRVGQSLKIPSASR